MELIISSFECVCVYLYVCMYVANIQKFELHKTSNIRQQPQQQATKQTNKQDLSTLYLKPTVCTTILHLGDTNV